MGVVSQIIESRQRPAWPRHSNYMSDIGHPCERYLVYARTHWEEKAPPSPSLIAAFEDGELHEQGVLAAMRKAGIKVQEEQTRLVDDYLKLSGKLDCRVILPDGGSYLVEVKSMSPWVWDKTVTYEDMLWSKFPWVRHYPAQMQAYLHYDRERNKQESTGLFLLKNKANGELREIEVRYDQEYAMAIMLKAERINKAVSLVLDVEGHVHEEHLPERLPVHEGRCENCDFRLTCMPDVDFGDAAEVVHDQELLGMLKRREELLPLVDEFGKLDQGVKAALKGRETVLIGEFVSHSKLQTRQSYQVKGGSYWVTTIKRTAE